MNDLPECTVGWCTNFSHTKKTANLCKAHYQRKYRGQDPEYTEVPQLRLLCLIEDCGQPEATRGLCPTHYTHARLGKIEIEGVEPKRFPQCSGPKCVRPGTKRGLCATHYAQLNKSPTGELYESGAKQFPKCLLADCERETTSLRAKLCLPHAQKRNKYGVTTERFVELMEITACESCGDETALVTDHVHGHHPRSSTMCDECIRGRLCQPCNLALGALRDSPARLEALLEYAVKHLPRMEVAALYG